MLSLMLFAREVARLFGARARWERLANEVEPDRDRPRSEAMLLGCRVEWGATLLPVERVVLNAQGVAETVVVEEPGVYVQAERPEGVRQLLFMERPSLGPAARALRDLADDGAMKVRDDAVRLEYQDTSYPISVELLQRKAVDMVLALSMSGDEELAGRYLEQIDDVGELRGHCLECLMICWGRSERPAIRAADSALREGGRLGALAGIVLGDPDALRSALRDTRLEDGLRARALVRALPIFDWEQRAQLVETALITGGPHTVAAGARGAAGLPREVAVRLIDKSLNAKSAEVWSPLLDVLVEVGEKLTSSGASESECRELLQVPLLRVFDGSPDLRERAAPALARLGATEPLQARLLQLLSPFGLWSNECEFAVAMLGRYGTIAAIEPLRELAEGRSSGGVRGRWIEESILQIQSRAGGDVGGLSVLAPEEEQGRLALADRREGGLALEDGEGD